MHEDNLITGVVIGLENRQITRLWLARRKQVDKLGSGPGIGSDGITGLLHPQLQHAGPGGPIPNDGVRHDAPGQRRRHQVGGEFSAGQRAVGKVPQRLLAGYRLVDTVHGVGAQS